MRVLLAGVIGVLAARPSPAYACFDSADCTSATDYFCDRSTLQCTPGVALCTNDDAGDQGGGDDYLSAARPLPLGTWVDAALCGGGATSPLQEESDWYAFDLPTDQTLVADLEHDGLVSATFVYFVGNIRIDRPGTGPIDVPAGRSYLALQRFTGVGITAAVPYRLLVHAVECRADSECTASAPSCANFRCVGGATCTGDDARDDGIGDDSYLVATRVALTASSPAVIDGALCGMEQSFEHGREADWYVVHVEQGADLDVSVSTPGTIPFFEVLGLGGYELARNAFFPSPPRSSVRLTYLPAGDYYVHVWLAPSAPTQPYQLTLVASSPHACTSRADCAAEYATQIYRGDCRAGACDFITPTDGVMDACDAHTNNCGCTYRPNAPGADASYCSYLGGWCMTRGRCPSNIGIAGVCRGYDPGNDPHCPSGCGHLGMCAACTSSQECGAGWTCNTRGQCIDLGLPPEDPSEPGGSPASTDNAGSCSTTSVSTSWLLLAALVCGTCLRTSSRSRTRGRRSRP